MKASRMDWDVFGYFIAVLLAGGLLLAITAVPGNSAEIFPSPRPGELVQIVQRVWEGRPIAGDEPCSQ